MFGYRKPKWKFRVIKPSVTSFGRVTRHPDIAILGRKRGQPLPLPVPIPRLLAVKEGRDYEAPKAPLWPTRTVAWRDRPLTDFEPAPLANQSLRDLRGRQAHAIQSTKQSKRSSWAASRRIRRSAGASIAHRRSGSHRKGAAFQASETTPSYGSTIAGVTPTNDGRRPHSSAFRPGGNEHARSAYAGSPRRHFQSHSPVADTRHSACARHSHCSSG